MSIMNYDPNVVDYTRQTVRLTFASWEARRVMEVDVPGGTGFDVIEGAISLAYESLPDRTYETLTSEPITVAVLELTYPDGDVLICEDEEQAGEDWLREMLIGAEIVAITASSPRGADGNEQQNQ